MSSGGSLPLLLSKERRSRRTHKNSRDGCPNCRAKRIKCTEELPSCQNCVKRNIRCGYLDFPKEKLDHIKKKNERKPEVNESISEDRKIDDLSRSTVSSGSRPSVATPLTNSMSSELHNIKAIGQQVPNMTQQQIPLEYPLDWDPHSNSNVGSILMEKFISPMEQLNYQEDMRNKGYTFILGGEFSSIESPESIPSMIAHSDTPIPPQVPSNTSWQKDSEVIPMVNSPHVLCGAINGPFALRKLERERKLRTSEFLNLVTKVNGGTFQSEFKVLSRPIWTRKHRFSIMRTVFHYACRIKVFFSFFIDHALNIILSDYHRASESELPDLGSIDPYVSQKILDESMTQDYISNSEEVKLLVNKYYIWYGIYIRQLRESLSTLHIEFPARLSLFSSLCMYLHLHPSAETLFMIQKGQAALHYKAIEDTHDLKDVASGILGVINFFNDQAITSVIPDYGFSIFEELFQDFKTVKHFLLTNSCLLEGGHYRSTIKSLLDIESFLHYIIEDFHPQVMRINNDYKISNGINDSSENKYFISVSMFFEMLLFWYRKSWKNHAQTAAKTAPIKIIKLMFLAVGKVLASVYTPIRSVMLTDPSNVVILLTEFEGDEFQFDDTTLTKEQYEFLTSLARKLLRLVKFFEFRQLFYAYYLTTKTILNDEYIQVANSSRDAKHPRMIQFLNEKVDVAENQLKSFADDVTINGDNFPITNVICDNHVLMDLLAKERQDQLLRQKSPNQFESQTLLYTHDFNPTALLDAFIEQQRLIFDINSLTLEELQRRMLNYYKGRVEVCNSLPKAS